MSEKEWYIATLVIASSTETSPKDKPIVDLQSKLVRASDPEEAFSLALELGEAEAQTYRNVSGNEISWRCHGLQKLEKLLDQELKHGTEVYSQLVRDDPEGLVTNKAELWEFWLPDNKDRTVEDLLNED